VLAGPDLFAEQGNMWDIPQFKRFLQQEMGSADVWEEIIQPAMKKAVRDTLTCAQVNLVPWTLISAH
jgi:hypothetical protein